MKAVLAISMVSAGCPDQLFRSGALSWLVHANNLTRDPEALWFGSAVSSAEIPFWSPVPVPPGIFVQASSVESAVEIAASVYGPVPNAKVSFFGDEKFPARQVASRLLPLSAGCKKIEAVAVWAGSVAVLARDCMQIQRCAAELVQGAEPGCCDAVVAKGEVSGKGAHRQISRSMTSAIEWLPSELFADPDEVKNVQCLAKVDIEAPAPKSAALPVLVLEYPLAVHARYVSPAQGGGYLGVRLNPALPVRLGLRDCDVKGSIWSRMRGAPEMKVVLPRGWSVVCGSATEAEGEDIQIPRGDRDDLQTVLPVSGITAVLGMLAIGISVLKG